MNINSHITTAAILTTLALTGCTIGDTPTATNNTASPQPTATQATQPAPSAQPFNNPVVSTTPPAVAPAPVANLIPPTNSTERLAIVQKGRSDPFGQIVQTSPIISQPMSSGKIEVPKLPPLPTTATNPKNPKNPPATSSTATLPKKPTATLPKKTTQIAQKPKTTTVLPKVLAGVVPPVKLKPVSPPVPQPETARAVVVSGVVLIGKVPQAIIKLPDEPTSRYVEPGRRLANGVLVKRIEMNQGLNPTVIFEQYGIEVAKQVGEQPAKESKPSTTASIGNAISIVKPKENLVGV